MGASRALLRRGGSGRRGHGPRRGARRREGVGCAGRRAGSAPLERPPSSLSRPGSAAQLAAGASQARKVSSPPRARAPSGRAGGAAPLTPAPPAPPRSHAAFPGRSPPPQATAAPQPSPRRPKRQEAVGSVRLLAETPRAQSNSVPFWVGRGSRKVPDFRRASNPLSGSDGTGSRMGRAEAVGVTAKARIGLPAESRWDLTPRH